MRRGWYELLYIRAGVDTALAPVVSVFGAARVHHAYWFGEKKGTNHLKMLHEGWGLWPCVHRLHGDHFIRACSMRNAGVALTSEQLQALVVGLGGESASTQRSAPGFMRQRTSERAATSIACAAVR